MKARTSIGITGWGSVSAAGHTPEGVAMALLQNTPYLQKTVDGEWAGAVTPATESLLQRTMDSLPHGRDLDRSVLLAVLAARQAVNMAGWTPDDHFGVLVGSSRGATHRWERDYQGFRNQDGRVSPLSSPLTTTGNLASWVAQDLQATGPSSSFSITCSTALHALLEGVVWLESGRIRRLIIGGTEAPLTPFTFSQMKALRIYAPATVTEYPCRALDLEKKNNTLVLGEGAACFACESRAEGAHAWIIGIGYGQEAIASPTGVSRQGEGLYVAMQRALADGGIARPDAIITHAPGTVLGDQAEYQAIQRLFGEQIPPLLNNKWQLGHTLGASGALSMELALRALWSEQPIGIAPYLPHGGPWDVPATILINAQGFGGNAISVLLQRGDEPLPTW